MHPIGKTTVIATAIGTVIAIVTVTATATVVMTVTTGTNRVPETAIIPSHRDPSRVPTETPVETPAAAIRFALLRATSPFAPTNPRE